jgi:uncharacterized protein (DUF2141 family)
MFCRFHLLLATGAMLITPALQAVTRAEFTVTGLLSSQGTVRAMLCSAQERFPNGCERRLAVPARAEGTLLVFEKMPPGRYALSVVHDEDDSKRLGVSTLSGQPKPIGFSNNVTGPGGLPSFNLAAVQVDDAAPLRQQIRLRGQRAR